MSRARYLDYQDPFGGNLFRGGSPSFGIVRSLSDTGLVSGDMIDQTRNFSRAFVLMPGGTSWGTSFLPKVGDVGLVLHNLQNMAYFLPFSSNYGTAIDSADDACALGFKQLLPGEVHTHSDAHGEELFDAMGGWTVVDSVGDFIQMEADSATLKMRAWNQMAAEYGFIADGSPAVTLVSGIDNTNGMYKIVGGVATGPNDPLYHIRMGAPGVLWFEGFNATHPQIFRMNKDGSLQVQSDGNSITLDSSGVLVQDVKGNTVTMNTAGISVTDDNNNTVKMTSAGISVKDKNQNEVTMTAAGIKIANTVTTLLTLLDGLIDVLNTLTTQGGPTNQAISPATVAQLTAYKLTLATLLQ